MTPDSVVEIMRHAILTAFWLAAPLLAIGFAAGIVVSLVQIATSMQDNAFSTIPRLVAFLAGLLILMPWMLQKGMAYTTSILETWADMPANLTLSLGTLLAFLLVLTRVAGAFVFVPLPGLSSVIAPVRVAFSLAFTLALSSRWPAMANSLPTLGVMASWLGAEAAVGIAIGVSVGIVIESFTLAFQVLGLPAGYGYASTVDPTTQADAGILVVLAQLVAGMFFFSLGLDREVLRLFAQSLDRVPAGAYEFTAGSATAMIRLGSNLFSVGVRLALPVVALLVMVDVALALMGRLNSQLQLLSLAFPAKMLVALMVLAWIAPLFPRVLAELSGHAWTTARKMLGM